MAWFLTLISGILVLLFVSSNLYMGYTNLERSITARSGAGIRVSPHDFETLKLRKKGLRISLLASIVLIVAGASMYATDSARERSSNAKVADPSLQLIPVPSDKGANYWLVSKASSGGLHQIVTRRNGSSGTTYSNRAYDCLRKQVMYLGDGSTLDEMRRSAPDSIMSPIVPGSIAHYVGLAACE